MVVLGSVRVADWPPFGKELLILVVLCLFVVPFGFVSFFELTAYFKLAITVCILWFSWLVH